MKIINLVKEIKNSIKEQAESAYKGVSAVLNLAGWVILAFLVIGFFTGTLQNVLDNLFIKHYYIYEAKNIDSPEGMGTLNDYVKSNFRKSEWGFERLDDEKYVTVSLLDENYDNWKLYYEVKNNRIMFSSIVSEDNSIDTNNTVNVDNNTINDNYSVQEYSSYKANELGKEFHSNYSRDNMTDFYNEDEIKQVILDSKFIGTSKTIGKYIDKSLDNVVYEAVYATTGVSLNIKGYSRLSGSIIKLEIVAANSGNIYLSNITEGSDNVVLDMNTKLEMAQDLFK